MKKCSFLLIIFYWSFSFSQIKNEKEIRINASEFPEILQSYFEGLSSHVKNLKFYKETDGEKLSYEAKFKFKNHYYSIEFDKNGVLEDVEVIIKKQQIPKETLFKISNYFKNNYDKASIIKIQKQYVNSSPKSDTQFIDAVLNEALLIPSYFEIIVETKKSNERQLQEFTFKNDGFFVRNRLLITPSYGHVLY